jgi:inward rectifier potassium channel
MAELPKVRLPDEKDTFPPISAVGQASSPLDDLYHRILTRSWYEFFFIVAVGFLGANALFAILFMLDPGCISNARPGNFEDAFYFSVQTMATIGYGGMAPVTRFAHIVVTLEALVGILSVALITGITFSKFARPRSRVLFSQKMVIHNRDGVPHLMFRMANWRHNRVLEANLRAFILVVEKTKEGEVMRRPLEINLVRGNTPIFVLTWTALHRIDEKSPFYGPDAIEKLRQQQGEIFLTLSGLDETFSQTIHARTTYKLDDIVTGSRFADVLTVAKDGSRTVDYRMFHQLVPIEPEKAPEKAQVVG